MKKKKNKQTTPRNIYNPTEVLKNIHIIFNPSINNNRNLSSLKRHVSQLETTGMSKKKKILFTACSGPFVKSSVFTNLF